MELAGYPNIDNPYTGTVYTAATTIYDSQNPSFFSPGDTFVDVEGGIYREQIFDDEYEARAAFEAQLAEVYAGSRSKADYSWPYDTISVIIFTREYENGLPTHYLGDTPFEETIIERQDIPLEDA